MDTLQAQADRIRDRIAELLKEAQAAPVDQRGPILDEIHRLHIEAERLSKIGIRVG